MGGAGSGRHSWFDTKATAEDCRVVDIGAWRRKGLLRRNAWITSRWFRGEQETASIGAWLVGKPDEEQVCAAVLVYRAGSGENARDVRETVPIGLYPVSWTPRHWAGSPEKESTMPKSRPPYPEAFRADAVALVRRSGKSIGEVAAELGVSGESLRTWVQQAKVDAGAGPPGALSSEEREERRRLRRENKPLQLEREILRKAAAFFAKEAL
jgi:transposase